MNGHRKMPVNDAQTNVNVKGPKTTAGTDARFCTDGVEKQSPGLRAFASYSGDKFPPPTTRHPSPTLVAVAQHVVEVAHAEPQGELAELLGVLVCRVVEVFGLGDEGEGLAAAEAHLT